MLASQSVLAVCVVLILNSWPWHGKMLPNVEIVKTYPKSLEVSGFSQPGLSHGPALGGFSTMASCLPCFPDTHCTIPISILVCVGIMFK